MPKSTLESKEREAKERRVGPRRFRKRWLALALFVLAGFALLTQPNAHRWMALPPNMGRIRWAETTTDTNVEPPLAPKWIRDMHDKGIPWPTDQPLKPTGAMFGAIGGGSEQTAVWYLIQSRISSNELWSLEKETVRMTDAQGKEQPWPGGSGSALVDSDRKLQYVYMIVPKELSGTGATLHFQLRRGFGVTPADRSNSVSLPF
jgi:hypothetical protein